MIYIYLVHKSLTPPRGIHMHLLTAPVARPKLFGRTFAPARCTCYRL